MSKINIIEVILFNIRFLILDQHTIVYFVGRRDDNKSFNLLLF